MFNSDRGGDQQLYIMGAGGGGAKRISFGQGRYATPVWSPRGDLIAFTRFGGGTGNFAIGVMHPDGTGERILSESWLGGRPDLRAERPRADVLARNPRRGRVRRTAISSRLVSIDITGFNERGLPTPTDASDPAWSPLSRLIACGIITTEVSSCTGWSCWLNVVVRMVTRPRPG